MSVRFRRRLGRGHFDLGDRFHGGQAHGRCRRWCFGTHGVWTLERRHGRWCRALRSRRGLSLGNDVFFNLFKDLANRRPGVVDWRCRCWRRALHRFRGSLLHLAFPGLLTQLFFFVTHRSRPGALGFLAALLVQAPDPLDKAAQHRDHDDGDLNGIDLGKKQHAR